MREKTNPGAYFEIPVSKMDRAVAFYKTVFGFEFEFKEIHGCQFALIPFEHGGSGVAGSLAKGDIYRPSRDGTLVYLRAENIDRILELAQGAGVEVLFPKTIAGDYAYVAEIEDSEGNRIGLMQPIAMN